MRLKTSLGAEYEVDGFNVVSSQALFNVFTEKTIGEMASDLDGVQTFSLYNPDTDEMKEYAGFTRIMTIVRQGETYFVSVERGGD